MPTIVFEPLVSSPETLGDGAASLPRLWSLGIEEAGGYGIDYLPRLVSISVGFVQDTTTGTGLGVLPALYGIGIEVAGGYGIAKLPALHSFGYDPSPLVPNAGSGLASLPKLLSTSVGFERNAGDALASLPRLFGFGNEAAGAWGVAELPRMRSSGVQTVVLPQTYLTLAVRPIMSLLASNTWVVSDQFIVTDSVTAQIVMSLLSNMQVTDAVSGLGDLIMALNSSLVARDYFIVVFDATITDNIDFADLNTTTIEMIMALADEMVLADSQLNWMSALTTIVSAMVLADAVRLAGDVNVNDDLVMIDLITAQQSLLTQIIEDLVMIDEVSGQLSMLALIDDQFAFSDSVSGTMALLMELLDNVVLRVRFSTPDGTQYVGYTINTRNAALSETTNFNFNSFASPPGATLAAGEDGIYQLGGATDQGAAIAASVRLGLSDFGTSTLKHVPNAYVGYTADGRLVMKVTTTDGGKKKENWYGLAPRTADSPVEGRFDIAKGLVARYWGFEVVNVDGADFELDSLKLWPMQLQRRKSGR